MKALLQQFLADIPALDATDKALMAEVLQLQQAKKGTVLQVAGAIADRCYFILQGCIRQYVVVDGLEKTTAFFTERQAVVSMLSYAQGLPCPHHWVCMEDCVMIAGTMAEEQAMYAQYPQLEGLTRTMLSQDFGRAQASIEAFITTSPEERYQQLLQARPDLVQRVPQHMIASYLGITAESLSRIRKRLQRKG